MATQRILYDDKETFQVSPLDEINKATAANYNELKDVINFNAQVLDDISEGTWVPALTTGDVSAIQNTVTSDITAQTTGAGDPTFTGIDWDITTTGRTSTGDVNFFNLKKDTVSKYRITVDGVVVTNGASSIQANDGTDTITWDASDNVAIPTGTFTIDSSPAATDITTWLNVAPNTDATTILGRMRIDSRVSNFAIFSHFTKTGGNDYALSHGVTGVLNLNTSAGQSINLRVENVVAWKIDSSKNLIGSSGNTLTVEDKIFANDRVALGLTTGDVASPLEGELWYNNTTNKFRANENGVNVDMIGTGGGALIQTALISVSSAELLAINTTPKTLIAAPGAGKRIIVHNVSSTLTFVTAAYTGDTQLELIYNGSSASFALININSAVDRFANHGGVFYNTTTDDFTNNSVELTTSTSDPLTGSGTITYVLEYSIVTI